MNIPQSLQFLVQKLSSDLFPSPDVTGFYGNSAEIYYLLHILIFLIAIPTSIFILIKSNISIKLKKFCTFFVLYIFLFINFIQIGGHFQYFSQEFQAAYNKTEIEKKTILMGASYIFAKECQKVLSTEKLPANLITDLDLSKGIGMTAQRQLAYYLYPKVNLRSHNQKENPIYLVYFFKKNAEQYIPSDYKIKYKYNKHNMLAIKKNYVDNF